MRLLRTREAETNIEKAVTNMTAQNTITGKETTRELLDLRRAHVRERRQRKATLLAGELLPLADYRPTELFDQTDSPKIA